MAQARSIKAWAFKRAKWIESRARQNERGRGTYKSRGMTYYQVPRVFYPLFTDETLSSLEPDPLTRAEQRQEIERADHLTIRELADVI